MSVTDVNLNPSVLLSHTRSHTRTLTEILDSMRLQLISRGPAAIRNLISAFVKIDRRRCSSVSKSELVDALQAAGIFLSTQHTSALFAFYAQGTLKQPSVPSDRCPYQALITDLQGPLSPTRVAIVTVLFRNYTRNPLARPIEEQQVALLGVDDFVNSMNVRNHPEYSGGVSVRSSNLGTMQAQWMRAFLGMGSSESAVRCGMQSDQRIFPGYCTLQEFLIYWEGISAAMASDDRYFYEVVSSMWSDVQWPSFSDFTTAPKQQSPKNTLRSFGPKEVTGKVTNIMECKTGGGGGGDGLCGLKSSRIPGFRLLGKSQVVRAVQRHLHARAQAIQAALSRQVFENSDNSGDWAVLLGRFLAEKWGGALPRVDRIGLRVFQFDGGVEEKSGAQESVLPGGGDPLLGSTLKLESTLAPSCMLSEQLGPKGAGAVRSLTNVTSLTSHTPYHKLVDRSVFVSTLEAAGVVLSMSLLHSLFAHYTRGEGQLPQGVRGGVEWRSFLNDVLK